MKKHLFLINLALVGAIVFWGWNTVKTWVLSEDVLVEKTEPTITEPKETREKKTQQKKRKLLRNYALVGKETLFRPEREEWTPPPPSPPPPPPPAPAPVEEQPPPPPPRLPDPILDGIIILSEDNRIALMKGSHRESSGSVADTPSRFRTRGRRGRRNRRSISAAIAGRVVTDKINRYRVGEEISEMTIEEILDDRVVLKQKDGKIIEIFLRSEEKTAKQITATPKTKKTTPKLGRQKTRRRRSPLSRRRSRKPKRQRNNANNIEDLQRAFGGN